MYRAAQYSRIRTRHVLVSAKNETSRVGPAATACTIHRLKPVLSMCPQLYSGCLGNSKKGTRPSIGGQEALAGSPHWSVFSSSSMWDERPALSRMPDACQARSSNRRPKCHGLSSVPRLDILASAASTTASNWRAHEPFTKVERCKTCSPSSSNTYNMYPFLTAIPPQWNLRPTTYLKPYHILKLMQKNHAQEGRGCCRTFEAKHS